MSDDDDPRPNRSTVPVDQLGRLAEAMTDVLAGHPEAVDDLQVIVILASESLGRRVTHLLGYNDDTEAMADLFVHMRSVVRASGRDIELIAIPNDISGLDST